MSKIKTTILDRVMRLKKAAHEGKDRLAQETRALTTEVLDEAVLQRDETVRMHAYPDTAYMSAYEATVEFGRQLHHAVSWHATNVGRRGPEWTKYDPAFTTPAMLKGLWEARQLCDSVGLPYSFFAQQALLRWEQLKKGRLPRPSQLCAPEVMIHVATLWADPAVQLRHPLPDPSQDARFGPECYAGDAVQQSVLRLIDQRLAFARSVDIDPAEILADALEGNISKQEASRRYGKEVVSEAFQVLKSRGRDIEDMLHALGTTYTGATVDDGHEVDGMGLSAA